jgi:hypothetical protein
MAAQTAEDYVPGLYYFALVTVSAVVYVLHDHTSIFLLAQVAAAEGSSDHAETLSHACLHAAYDTLHKITAMNWAGLLIELLVQNSKISTNYEISKNVENRPPRRLARNLKLYARL